MGETLNINKSNKSTSVRFRIVVGSYEHILSCLSVTVSCEPSSEKTPIFQPIFHFEAHSLSIRALDQAKRYLVSGSNDEHIKIYDLQKRKEIGSLLQHTGSITCLKFSRESSKARDADGKWLLSGSEDGSIIVWRTKDWEPVAVLKGHKAAVNDLAIHPSGKVAVSVSNDKTIRLWNLMSSKLASTLKMKGKDTLGQSGHFVKWSFDGEHFIVALVNRIFVYHTRTAKLLTNIPFQSTIMKIEVVQLEKEYLITCHSNGEICFYSYECFLGDVEKLQPDYKLLGHSTRVKDISIYQDDDSKDSFLVSVASDGKIVVWSLKTFDQVAVYATSERLTVVTTMNENIEDLKNVKKTTPKFEAEDSDFDSEAEVLLNGTTASTEDLDTNKSLVSIVYE
ncbi:60S ribosomal subunit biogenesis protein [Komagataella phaffii CBS 7435]|uniref:Protein involved in an early, nucleolar step of 60S ribosomal subunit biogenesis n=2 Tax=Komagataella phaffii TaxID=460519 RepID=C4QX50_KOMPG|nr:Protein involved in an early, nucleolar step of 60S ribosomal subunit biogenesis [Komagataella phaffii GS115]AOA61057.1 GQ67_02200T0 [Komagataella phaffii]CAH2446623.1 60S ribosomal subunit biogenesis protein [Komagataella phaffii CBS 7435]AOA65665.1 GQ68_02215T0 [Komagataella phaffii GS115]CAY67823.1 Protein involved in an early, nucleolar step of 60S ribosomal subunit biogenesis [Komagataella phaffii GS115]CCA36905.1 60S ribosomal subunit biogenesis protein [Komagataella phaffii CBS 7435]